MAGRTPLCEIAQRASLVAKYEWYDGYDKSRWQVIYRSPERICGHVAWVCKCQCGQAKLIRADFLVMRKAGCPYM